MVATYVLEFEVQTSVSPAGAGTVSPGGWIAREGQVRIAATASANFRFVEFSGDAKTTSNPVDVRVKVR